MGGSMAEPKLLDQYRERLRVKHYSHPSSVPLKGVLKIGGIEKNSSAFIGA
jgi:hypothetical protein